VLFVSVLLSQYQIKTDEFTDVKKVEFNDARRAKDVFKVFFFFLKIGQE
jgi:hypothetical protein